MAGLSYNEMSAARWQRQVTLPEGDGLVTRSLGDWILLQNGMFTESYWHWMPALVLIGYWALFTGVIFLALQYLPRKFRRMAAFSSFVA